MCKRNHRQRKSLQLLRAGNGFAGHGAESLHRLREGSRDRQRSGRDRTVDHRNCAREEASERGGDQGNSRSRAHDRTRPPARCRKETRRDQSKVAASRNEKSPCRRGDNRGLIPAGGLNFLSGLPREYESTIPKVPASEATRSHYWITSTP